MTTARTTSTLICSAVKATKAAGITVGAIEVEKGGVIRIIAIDAMPRVASPQGENSCDAILEEILP